ncbi:MAG TPA: hypothetical protein VKA92_08395 [Segetibacter sp.]|nr:hypothetical protein [Segetibacter sp.]
MSETNYISAAKDCAVSSVELLKKTAIEDLELQQFELSESQKAAIDRELDLITNNLSYLRN